MDVDLREAMFPYEHPNLGKAPIRTTSGPFKSNMTTHGKTLFSQYDKVNPQLVEQPDVGSYLLSRAGESFVDMVPNTASGAR